MVGSDRVVHKGELVLVYSKVDMPDWQVRAFRRTAIVFANRTYFVAKKDAIGASFRYVLESWNEAHTDMPGKTIFYDEDYVRHRDLTMSVARRRDLVYVFLRPFKPLIGLLPSSVKLRIEDHYGILARSATLFSLWFELAVFLNLGILTWVFTYAALRSSASSGMVAPTTTLGFLVPGELLILSDMVMRYSDYLSEARIPCGLLEWVFRTRKRN